MSAISRMRSKTPLSVITNEARGSDGPFAAKVIEQAEIMRTQITHHLDRARVAARSGAIGDITDVEAVLAALKRALERIYDGRGLALEMSAEPGLKFQGEKQDFEEMVGNLLDNACKWAKSQVRLEAAQADGSRHFTVLVDDDGPGLDRGRARKGGEARPAARRVEARLGPRAVHRGRSRPSL